MVGRRETEGMVAIIQQASGSNLEIELLMKPSLWIYFSQEAVKSCLLNMQINKELNLQVLSMTGRIKNRTNVHNTELAIFACFRMLNASNIHIKYVYVCYTSIKTFNLCCTLYYFFQYFFIKPAVNSKSINNVIIRRITKAQMRG